MGDSASISLVPAAEPRMSTPPTVPSGHRMTVHPVQPTSSVPCPTRIPGMAVSMIRLLRWAHDTEAARATQPRRLRRRTERGRASPDGFTGRRAFAHGQTRCRILVVFSGVVW